MTQYQFDHEDYSYRNTYQQFDSLNRSQKILTDAEVKAGVLGNASKKGKAPSAFVYMKEVI